MNKIGKLIFATLFFLIAHSWQAEAQYAINDYGSITTGNWGTNATWGLYNGTDFTTVPATQQPTSADNVWILSGTTVTLDATGKSCLNLTVEGTALLYSNTGAGGERYISVFGNIDCEGVIGNGTTYDVVAFNIEGTNDTIYGAGVMDASSIRKRAATPNSTTNLIINRNINLRYSSATANASASLYNDATAACVFNVTISSGDTVVLDSSAIGTYSSASIDGAAGGSIGNGLANNLSGTFTINGVLDIQGIMWAYTQTNASGNSCNWIVNGELRAYDIRASASSAGTNSITVNSGGKLNLTGTPGWSILSFTSNSYIFNSGTAGGTVEYSAIGNQAVKNSTDFGAAAISQYWNLIISGAGNKTISASPTVVKKDLTIKNTTGSPVLIPTNFSINVGGNWTNYAQTGYTEGTGTYTVTLNGTTTQTITCPGGEVFNSLTLNNSTAGDSIIMNDPVTVDSTLTFLNVDQAPLYLNGHQLTLIRTNAAAISIATAGAGFANRYIVSESAVGNALYATNPAIIKWKMPAAASGTSAYTFPFGYSGNKVPVVIAKKATATTVDVSVSTRATALSDNRPWDDSTNVGAVTSMSSAFVDPTLPYAAEEDSAVIDRWWDITSSTPFLAVDTIKFTYRGAENTMSSGTTQNIYPENWNGNYTNAGWKGRVGPFSAGVTVGTGTSTTLSDTIRAAPWVLVGYTHRLPVTWLGFTARFKNDHVDVEWQTASEINCEKFEVERSSDAKLFTEIGEVNGAGTSSIIHSYYFADRHPLKGLSYYRLRQVDFDGHFKYSDVVPVLNMDKNADWYVFPNPATDHISIANTGSRTVPGAVFELISPDGSVIKTMALDAKNQSIISFDISDLSNGVYFGKITDDFNHQVFKIVKN